MAAIMGTATEPTALRALDPDLPIVAARAAMQIDSLIAAAKSGTDARKLRTDAINQLGSMMSNISSAISRETGDLASRSLMDALTANIVSRAYSDASHNDLKSVNDLRAAADKLVDLFKRASTADTSKQEDPLSPLVLLRDFCIKLSEYAASKRQLAYGERPMPSYWRLQ